MQRMIQFLTIYDKFGIATVPVKSWDLFTKVFAAAFLAFWLHLGNGLNDWLGSEGFHLPSPGMTVFAPLPAPFPQVLWWLVFGGGLLLFSQRTVAIGCVLAGAGFFYATLCDAASVGALNMHFIFALMVIFWSTSLYKTSDQVMSAWPTFLIRLYLAVTYFGSGWRKAIYGDWLNTSDTLAHCMTGFYTTGLNRWLHPITSPFIWTLAQYTTIAFELGAPLLLLYSPIRKWGVLLGCLLHVGIALLMKDLFYFSLQMLSFYIPVMIRVSYLPSALSKRDHQPET